MPIRKPPPVLWLCLSLVAFAFLIHMARMAVFKEGYRLQTSVSLTPNVFKELHTKYPVQKKASPKSHLPVHVDIPLLENDVILGPPRSKVDITAFWDTACLGKCAKHIRDILKISEDFPGYAVRVVLKFTAQDDSSMNLALFAAMAEENNVLDDFLRDVLEVSPASFSKQGKSGEIAHYVNMLEKAGVPLKRQRDAMPRLTRRILLNIQQNNTILRTLSKKEEFQQEPLDLTTLFLGGYWLGTPLETSKADVYLQRLVEGKSVL